MVSMKRTLSILTYLFLISLFQGCTYRYLRPLMRPPFQMKSLAIGGIYDVSRSLCPHPILWNHLQKAWIASGKVPLTSWEKADVRMGVQILSLKKRGEDFYQDPKSPSIKFTKSLNFQAKINIFLWRGTQTLWQSQEILQGSYPVYDTHVPSKNFLLYEEETWKMAWEKASERFADNLVKKILSLDEIF